MLAPPWMHSVSAIHVCHNGPGSDHPWPTLLPQDVAVRAALPVNGPTTTPAPTADRAETFLSTTPVRNRLFCGPGGQPRRSALVVRPMSVGALLGAEQTPADGGTPTSRPPRPQLPFTGDSLVWARWSCLELRSRDSGEMETGLRSLTPRCGKPNV